ncbi:TraB/GumN family protein [Pelagibius sp. CAU 1746]|uniref:TraB/GumN family protein n=1 Tax=Pelagibius sp. CAU 1746 TaxID=3140370 RepID=UPI00325AAEB3
MRGLSDSLGLWRRETARRLAAPVAAVLLLVVGGCGPTLPTVWPSDQLQPLPEPADVSFGEGRIWQIDLPGQEPSYLFGTIHVTNPEVFDLPEAAETAFDKARFAAFETGLEEDISEEEKTPYFELAEDATLQGVLGEESYRRMKALFLFRYYRIKRLDRLQPWVVWFMIGGREISAGLRREKGKPILDDWLQSRALEEGKEVIPLETTREHLNVFAGIPLEDQVSMLNSAVDNFDKPRTKVERLELYLKGDLAQRYALWERQLEQMDPEVARRFHDRIMDGRNRTMVESLLPVFEKGSTFVAVGALHMPGERGMLSLLEQRGYTVTRLE